MNINNLNEEKKGQKKNAYLQDPGWNEPELWNLELHQSNTWPNWWRSRDPAAPNSFPGDYPLEKEAKTAAAVALDPASVGPGGLRYFW